MFVGVFGLTTFARAQVPGYQDPNTGLSPNTQTSSSSSSGTCSALSGIGNIICTIHQILDSIIPVLIALGVLYFVWGVVQYIIGGNEEAKSKGRERIIYGIIGFAVIIGVWGLVNIISSTFGLNGTVAPPIPTIGAVTGTCTFNPSNSKLQDLFGYISCIILKSFVPLVFALALAMFVWGVVQFVLNTSEEVKREKGKQFMLWGIVALTVMVCVWGLVSVLGRTFGVDTNYIPQVKQ